MKMVLVRENMKERENTEDEVWEKIINKFGWGSLGIKQEYYKKNN